MTVMKINQADADLIRALGGPSKVAELLKMEKRGGAQRVQNWLVRGIPSRVKVDHPDLFMPQFAAPSTVPQQPTPQGAPHAA